MTSSAASIELENQHSAKNYNPLPVVLSKAKGSLMWDPEGKQYYDFLSAYSAVNQGHSHPRITQALVDQAQTLALTSRAFHNDVYGEYAKFMTETFGFERIIPMNTGAEAVETAIKIARRWGYDKKGIEENKAIVMTVGGNFHGRTISIISFSSDPDARGRFGPYTPGLFCPAGNTLEYGNYEQFEKAVEVHGANMAAFLVEPIQGEAGIVVPPEGYLRKCYDLCKKHNILFIADEIQTGLCRTGRMLAIDHEDIKPDMIILGKALSGGLYPVSAVLTSAEVMDVITPGSHGSTYGGNPLGCKVAIEAVKVLLDEKLADRAQVLGERFRSELSAFCKDNAPYIETVRGRGLLNAVVVDHSKSDVTAGLICLLLKDRGLLAKPTHKNIIRFAPPLVMTDDEFDACLAIIKGVLTDIPNMKREEIPGYEWDH